MTPETIHKMAKVLKNVENIFQLRTHEFTILVGTLNKHETDILLHYAFGYIQQVEEHKDVSLAEILKLLE